MGTAGSSLFIAASSGRRPNMTAYMYKRLKAVQTHTQNEVQTQTGDVRGRGRVHESGGKAKARFTSKAIVNGGKESKRGIPT